MFEHLLEDSSFWSAKGRMSDVVLSSRLQLARNVANAPFPAKQAQEDSKSVEELARKFAANAKYAEDLIYYRLSDIEDYDKRFLRERGIFSEEMENSPSASFIFDAKQRYIIHVNASNHFCIQILNSGIEFYEAYRDLVDVDNELNTFVEYAFSEKYGFLTAGISNAGTGLSARALLHLPVLTTLNSIPEVTKMVEELGAVFSPVTQDENKNYGSFYTVENKHNGSDSEVDILEMLDDVVKMVAHLEIESRDEYASDFKVQLHDRVSRSYGILSYARTMSYVEALEYLSNLRLGIILNYIKEKSLEQVNDLLVKIQPAHLQKISGRELSGPSAFDECRAELLRKEM